MNVIAFKEKRQEKMIKFERKVLKEVSLRKLKGMVGVYFSPFFRSQTIFTTAIEDGSIDVAIEAYLLGAHMSRFGYYGESMEDARKRRKYEEQYLIDSVFDYLQYWDATGGNDLEGESLYVAATQFIDYWWREGFKKGERRYKLRLH
jgi:hypothetical protein